MEECARWSVGVVEGVEVGVYGFDGGRGGERYGYGGEATRTRAAPTRCTPLATTTTARTRRGTHAYSPTPPPRPATPTPHVHAVPTTTTIAHVQADECISPGARA